MISMGVRETRIERWFRILKERTKRFYNNVNSKRVKVTKELAKARALTHNPLIRSREAGKHIT